MPSSPKTDACNTQERSAAMGATLRLLQLACSIHEELTNCHIIWTSEKHEKHISGSLNRKSRKHYTSIRVRKPILSFLLMYP